MSQVEPPPNKVAQFAYEWKNWLHNLWNNQSSLETRIATLEAASGGGSGGLTFIESKDLVGLASYEVTGIPTTTSRIMVAYYSLSSTNNSSPSITLGDSTGYATAGRVVAQSNGVSSTWTNGAAPIHSGTNSSSDLFSGSMDLINVRRPEASAGSAEFWAVNGHSHETLAEVNNTAGYINNGVGTPVDRVKIQLITGTFDSASAVAFFHD